jgi:hypothetical protein
MKARSSQPTKGRDPHRRFLPSPTWGPHRGRLLGCSGLQTIQSETLSSGHPRTKSTARGNRAMDFLACCRAMSRLIG